jgi:hypothetical protein
MSVDGGWCLGSDERQQWLGYSMCCNWSYWCSASKGPAGMYVPSSLLSISMGFVAYNKSVFFGGGESVSEAMAWVGVGRSECFLELLTASRRPGEAQGSPVVPSGALD